MTNTHPSWEEIHQITHDICKKIEIDGIDLLIGLSVGGLVPTALCSLELDYKAVATISARSYEGNVQNGLILNNLPKKCDVEGRSILLIDDIVDSGKTLREIKCLLYGEYGAKKVSSAALYVRKGTPEYPDHWGRETSQWVEFPWEKKWR